jgi:hypothetical protein
VQCDSIELNFASSQFNFIKKKYKKQCSKALKKFGRFCWPGMAGEEKKEIN